MQALIDNFRNLANFSGRTPRRIFWPYVGVVFGGGYILYMVALFPAVAGILSNAVDGTASRRVIFDTTTANYEMVSDAALPVVMPPMMAAMLWAAALFVAIMVVFLAAAIVRRLHDANRSGWWALMPIPFLGIGFACMPYVMTNDFENDPFAAPLFLLLFGNNVIYLASIVVLIVFLAQPSTQGANRYGPLP